MKKFIYSTVSLGLFWLTIGCKHSAPVDSVTRQPQAVPIVGTYICKVVSKDSDLKIVDGDKLTTDPSQNYLINERPFTLDDTKYLDLADSQRLMGLRRSYSFYKKTKPWQSSPEKLAECSLELTRLTEDQCRSVASQSDEIILGYSNWLKTTSVMDFKNSDYSFYDRFFTQLNDLINENRHIMKESGCKLFTSTQDHQKTAIDFLSKFKR